MAKLFYYIKAAVVKAALYLIDKVGIRPKVIFTDPKRKKFKYDGPVIFVGNHTSYYDGIMTTEEFAKTKPYVVLAKDWFEKPVFCWYLKKHRCISMDRYNLDTEWLRQAKEAIHNGSSVIMYPEGKTSKEPFPDEFKSGFVILALLTGAKIVPFAIEGQYKMVFGRRQRLMVSEPMELTKEGKGMNPKYLEAESERFRQIVIEMKKTLKGDK